MPEQKKDHTILVVEDERPLAEAIRIKLQKSGFEVVTARTVEQALNFMEEISAIEAVWLDHYLLGKENGLDFVAKMKQPGSKWTQVPIFVVSNTASPDKVQSYLHLGISKYYVKAEHRLEEIIGAIKGFLLDPKE